MTGDEGKEKHSARTPAAPGAYFTRSINSQADRSLLSTASSLPLPLAHGHGHTLATRNTSDFPNDVPMVDPGD